MDPITSADVKVATGAETGSNDLEIVIKGVSTDSRTVRPGELFVALDGPHYSGDDYAGEALRKGAVGALVSRIPLTGKCDSTAGLYFVVKDTLFALGELARFYRKHISATVIGVTGSNGKTTTKDMIYHVLSNQLKAMKSQKSFNNFVGVPLTLFMLDHSHQVGVLEFGASNFREIQRLAEIAKPKIGVVTNIGEAHLESFRDLDGVARAKGELLEALDADSVAILNGDDPRCLQLKQLCRGKVVTYGFEPHCDIQAESVKRLDRRIVFQVTSQHDSNQIELGVPGMVNVHNALATIAVAREFEVNMEVIADRLRNFQLPSCRMQIEDISGVIFFNDTYNANPVSVRAALSEFSRATCSGQRILVLGSMLELGDSSEALHQALWQDVKKTAPDVLITVGKEIRSLAQAVIDGGMSRDHVHQVENYEQTASVLVTMLQKGNCVLLKGSRAMQMDKIVDIIRKKRGSEAEAQTESE